MLRDEVFFDRFCDDWRDTFFDLFCDDRRKEVFFELSWDEIDRREELVFSAASGKTDSCADFEAAVEERRRPLDALGSSS